MTPSSKILSRNCRGFPRSRVIAANGDGHDVSAIVDPRVAELSVNLAVALIPGLHRAAVRFGPDVVDGSTAARQEGPLGVGGAANVQVRAVLVHSSSVACGCRATRLLIERLISARDDKAGGVTPGGTVAAVIDPSRLGARGGGETVAEVRVDTLSGGVRISEGGVLQAAAAC